MLVTELKKMNILLFLLVIFSIIFTSGNTAKILTVFPFGSYSHFTLGFKLVKELVERGHEVTFINSFPQGTPMKNFKEISVAEVNDELKEIKNHYYKVGTYTYLGQLDFVANVGYFYTEIVMKHKNVQNLLKSEEKFDLVIMEHLMNEAMFIFAHRFNCPSIIFAPGPTTVFNNYLFANPSQPTYIPSLLADYDSHMSLWERFKNTYYDITGQLFIHLVMLKKQDEILKRTVPNAPNLQDIMYNSSLMFLISHISLKEPAPLQISIKEIGGYHVGPLKPLPEELQEFLDNAQEGVIVFSMGSLLNSSAFPQKTKEAILRAFSKIKQKVLWKFETDLPEKPKNVKIMNWIPQQDILAHPNVILLITHVGLLSTIEAVYHGVPMLGLPVFWDQEKNAENAIRRGMALKISFPQINNKNFDWTLNELINNPMYRENAKKSSKIMHDLPMKQMDETVYWIEYVIRHKGAPHLRSAALDLKWYQRYLIDVGIIFGVIILGISRTLSFGFRLIFRKQNTRVDIGKKNL